MLQDCRGIAPEALISALPQMMHLRAIRLDGMLQVTSAELLAEILIPMHTHAINRLLTRIISLGEGPSVIISVIKLRPDTPDAPHRS